MFTKIFSAVALSGALWVSGDAAYQSVGCCSTGSECCYPAQECCVTDSCSVPAAPCCEVVINCCEQ